MTRVHPVLHASPGPLEGRPCQTAYGGSCCANQRVDTLRGCDAARTRGRTDKDTRRNGQEVHAVGSLELGLLHSPFVTRISGTGWRRCSLRAVLVIVTLGQHGSWWHAESCRRPQAVPQDHNSVFEATEVCGSFTLERHPAPIACSNAEGKPRHGSGQQPSPCSRVEGARAPRGRHSVFRMTVPRRIALARTTRLAGTRPCAFDSLACMSVCPHV